MVSVGRFREIPVPFEGRIEELDHHHAGFRPRQVQDSARLSATPRLGARAVGRLAESTRGGIGVSVRPVGIAVDGDSAEPSAAFPATYRSILRTALRAVNRYFIFGLKGGVGAPGEARARIRRG